MATNQAVMALAMLADITALNALPKLGKRKSVRRSRPLVALRVIPLPE